MKEWKIKPVNDVATEYLNIIIQKYKYSNSLINIFGINNEDSSQIELKILRVCLNSKFNDLIYFKKYFHDEEKMFAGAAFNNKNNIQKKNYDKLKLTLEWNRVDLANSDVFTGEEEFSNENKNDLFEMALIQDRPLFLEIILETGFDLKSFLTYNRLLSLYQNEEVYICVGGH